VLINGAVQWGLVDSGAELSLVSTAFASFAGLVEENQTNVSDRGLVVRGVNGVRSPAQIINTSLILGRQQKPERGAKISAAVISNDAYKLVLGMDLLGSMKAVVDVANRRITLSDAHGKRFALPLYQKDEVRRSPEVAAFRKWITGTS
jgi:predicted aspartyl protease